MKIIKKCDWCGKDLKNSDDYRTLAKQSGEIARFHEECHRRYANDLFRQKEKERQDAHPYF